MCESRWISGLLLLTIMLPLHPALLPSGSALHAQQDTTASRAKDGKKKEKKPDGKKDEEKGKKGDGTAAAEKKAKTPEPGDRKKIVKDSLEAEARPLFAVRAPLPFTLIANFGAISKNRDSTNTERYSGTLVTTDSAGAERRIPVQLRTRGHFRLMRRTCKFVNLLVRFPDKGKETDGTPFAGQKSLKLGAHCQDDARYEQLLLKEYLAYRILQTVSPRGFRARLATGTYIDSANGKNIGTRVAMWIENEDDMARRQAGRLRDFRRALFDDMDAATLDQMAIYEYLIGNTDWSIYALHNVRIVVSDSSAVYPIPYDFDFSGLVNAPYSAPAPQLNLRSVRDRLFRGPCRPWEVIAPSIARFVERETDIMKLPDEIPGLRGNEARDVRDYLSVFFEVARNKSTAKETFVDGCLKKPGA